MEARLVLQQRVPQVPVYDHGITSYRRKSTRTQMIKRSLSIHAALTTRHADTNTSEAVITTDIPTTGTVYKDNWLDRIAINYLSQNLQRTTGLRNSKTGYDSLVDAARVVTKNFDIKQQQELITQSLDNAFPGFIMSLIRTLLPNSKFARECSAIFTTLFFAWLVGPCEVKGSEINGETEKNVVHVKKCRFLEQSNCVGMCVNLCKIPSQSFVKNSLGLPFNMVPNFDDMSCDMVFGQEPPGPASDPALKQPCFALCKSKQRHSEKCSS